LSVTGSAGTVMAWTSTGSARPSGSSSTSPLTGAEDKVDHHDAATDREGNPRVAENGGSVTHRLEHGFELVDHVQSLPMTDGQESSRTDATGPREPAHVEQA